MDRFCPTLPGSFAPMKSRVTLEPELEEFAGEWGPLHCLEVAEKWVRWGRQLRMKARITLRDRSWPTPKPALRNVPPRKLVLN